MTHPHHGIDFLTNTITGNPGNMTFIWKHVDWYTIICSLMLQYENVYADLSYIIHNSEIQPLLKVTLQNEELKGKVLFGSDFYVVRNHKSEKSIYAQSIDNLTEDEFDQIARINPRVFLENKVHGRSLYNSGSL